MSLYKKKNKEKEVADFFSYWLNDLLKYDFESITDPDDQNIDYILKSKSDKFKTKYLQLTTCDELIIKTRIESTKNPYPNIFNSNGIIENYIKKAILDKSIKKYPSRVQEQLILIVWSDNFLTPKIDAKYLKKEVKNICDQTNFKEIFYIALPKIDEKKFLLKKGQIINLK